MTDRDGRKFEYMKRLEYHDISHARHRILTVFWNHTDSRLENAFPARETVAAKANVSLTTLDSAIKWAKDNGYLQVQAEATSHKPVTYRLPMPPDLAPSEVEEELDGSPTIGEAQTGSPVSGEGGSPTIGEGGSPVSGDLTDHVTDQRSDPPATPVRPEPGPEDGGSFQEWINLFPSSKRRNVKDARSRYQDTITSGIDHHVLVEATQAYLEATEAQYIGQAHAVLEDRRWEKFKPAPDQSLLNIGAMKANRSMYQPGDSVFIYYTEEIEKSEQRLIRQGYVRGQDGNLMKLRPTPEQKKAQQRFIEQNPYLLYS